MFRRIPGTKDILPEEVSYWQKIEETSRSIFSVYNYKEIRVPLIEEAALFNRSLGESAEIVQKQMFLIDGGDAGYALRPEGTAPVVRAYIENNLDKKAGFVKLYYIGPMFRRERPQKGRLRQFHHVGCEVLGSREPEIDAEVISLAAALLKAYSIDGCKIKINSLGCSEDKQKLNALLKKGLTGRTEELCGECRVRFERNILRILDCKNEACQEAVRKLDIGSQALSLQSYLCNGCQAHFAKVKAGLDYLDIEYEVWPYLVRGLDYYTRTVFEIKHDALGAQDAVAAGGRYDTLVKELGGPDIPAIGFAFGIERLLLVSGIPSTSSFDKLRTRPERSRRPSLGTGGHQAAEELVYIISLGEEAKLNGLKLLADLRAAGITCDTDYENKSLKAALRKANDLGARCVLIIGEDELKKNMVMLKDMVSGEQKEVKTESLINELSLLC